jgi:RIO-like serine/threonine protein kinase
MTQGSEKHLHSYYLLFLGVGSSFSSTSSPTASLASTIETYPSSVKTFSISELEKATENFSFTKVIGEGGYGRVYRGVNGDDVEVAVKLLTRKHQNRDREFVAEVEMLSRLHHRNLVKLIGICIERSTRCLVFELVPNGSVESHLHGL